MVTTDLIKLYRSPDEDETFTFGDTDYTREEVEAGLMKNADYTQKTQAVADKERSLDDERKAFETEKSDFKANKGSKQDDDDANLSSTDKMLKNINQRMDDADKRTADKEALEKVNTEVETLKKDNTPIGDVTKGDIMTDNYDAIAKLAGERGLTADAALSSFIVDNMSKFTLSEADKVKLREQRQQSADTVTDRSNKSGGKTVVDTEGVQKGENLHQLLERKAKK